MKATSHVGMTERIQDEALKASERLLSLIYRTVSDSIFMLSVGEKDCYRFNSVNAAFLKTTGLEWEEIRNKRIEEVLPPSSHARVSAKFGEAIRDNTSVRWAISLDLPAGRRAGEIVVTPMYDAAAGGLYLVGVIRDVTERERAGEERRLIFERITDAFVALDKNWRYTYVNSKAAQMFGRRAEDLVGKHIWTEFPEGVTQKFQSAYEKAMAEQKPIVLEEYYSPYGKWFENRIYPSPEGLSIYFHDITERKLAEVTLRESEQQLRTIIETEPECVKVVGPTGELLEMNAAGLAMLEAGSVEEARAHTLMEFIRPEYRAAFGALHRRVMRGEGGLLEFEVTGLRGTRRWLETHAAPMRDMTGQVKMLLGITRDITERKRAVDELLLLDQMKTNFIRMAAHELKTPITVVKGFAQLALREPQELSPRVLSSLNAVNRGADRIALIVNDLLDLSRLQSGKATYNPRRADLNLLIKEVVDNLSVTLADPARLCIVTAASIFVNADPSRIEQVLSNLITNAVRYSPHGGPIEISVSRDGGTALVSVKDSGVGIPQKSQSRIFQPFYSAHAETPFDFGGMGIGLYISKEIIVGHGGTLWFESTEGKGSTFFFRLPLAE